MTLRRTLAAALLCALACSPAFAADQAAAPTVKWVNPWKPGTSLTYATEDLTTETQGDKREQTRGTSNTTVAITQASKDGFVQAWTGKDARFQVVEGDKAKEALMQRLTQAFDGVVLEVELDAAGNYARARNIAELAPKLRAAFLEGAMEGAERELAASDKPAAEADEIRKKVRSMVEGMADRMTAPAPLETLLTRNVQWYNGFVGIDIEPDQRYELETELPNAFGGPAFPVKLTFSLSVSPDDPDDLYVGFEQAIDPVKGKAAILAATQALIGQEIPEGAMDDLAFSMLDEGLFIVHGPTGAVEMSEFTRTTKVGDKVKVERNRMRLTNGEHEHVWRDETQATPQGPEADA